MTDTMSVTYYHKYNGNAFCYVIFQFPLHKVDCCLYISVCATSVTVRVKVKRNYPCKSVESVGKLVKKLDLILQDSSSFAIPCSDEYDEIQYATARVYNV